MNEHLQEVLQINPPADPFVVNKLKPAKKEKKKSYKMAITKTVIKTAVLISFVGVSVWQINKYDIQFRSPIQNPLVITERSQIQIKQDIKTEIAPEVKAAPLPSPKEIILASKHPNTIWAIYGLESSYGKNDKCIRDEKGFNGLGFGQSATVSNCFQTFETGVDALDLWLTDHSNMDIGKVVCYYNTGKIINTCLYYEKFKQIFADITK